MMCSFFFVFVWKNRESMFGTDRTKSELLQKAHMRCYSTEFTIYFVNFERPLRNWDHKIPVQIGRACRHRNAGRTDPTGGSTHTWPMFISNATLVLGKPPRARQASPPEQVENERNMLPKLGEKIRLNKGQTCLRVSAEFQSPRICLLGAPGILVSGFSVTFYVQVISLCYWGNEVSAFVAQGVGSLVGT